ncbi:MAG: hypothetical protein WC981_03405 [Candidatus Dojkabacteria bacterium]
MVIEYYCGTAEDIRRYLTTVSIGSGIADTIKDDASLKDTFYEVNQEIDSILSAMYYVPLRKVKRSGIIKFPDPIKQIAIRMVSGILIDAHYQASNPAVSAYGKNMKEEALLQLHGIINGDEKFGGMRILDGQKMKAGRNHFVSSGIKPAKSPNMTSSPSGAMGIE